MYGTFILKSGGGVLFGLHTAQKKNMDGIRQTHQNTLLPCDQIKMNMQCYA